MPDTSAYQAALDAAFAEIDAMTEQEAGAILQTLAELRAAIIDRLALAAQGSDAYTTAVLTSLMGDIDRLGSTYTARITTHLEQTLTAAWDTATAALPAALLELGIDIVPFVAIDSTLLQMAVANSADLVTAVTQQAIAAITQQVRLGALGGLKISEVMRRVQDILRTQPLRNDPRLGTFVQQAERIVRDQIMNVYDYANEIRQQQAAQVIPGLRKYWLTAQDSRVRDDHVQAGIDYSRENAIPVEDDFVVGGETCRYPKDPSLSPEQSINCFPGSTMVRAVALERAYRRFYEGETITIEMASGNQLTGTPNHPIATAQGWVPLGEIREGYHVLNSCGLEGMASSDPDVFHAPAPFAEGYASLAALRKAQRVRITDLDFHGDRTGGYVDVVSPGRQLGDRLASPLPERLYDLVFPPSDVTQRLLFGESPAFQFGPAANAAANRIMGRGSVRTPFVGAQSSHSQQVGVAAVAAWYAVLAQLMRQPVARYPEPTAYAQEGLPSDVRADEVVNVDVGYFRGHVYNLQTASGFYTSNGIIVHNCRCRAVSWSDTWEEDIVA